MISFLREVFKDSHYLLDKQNLLILNSSQNLAITFFAATSDGQLQAGPTIVCSGDIRLSSAGLCVQGGPRSSCYRTVRKAEFIKHGKVV